MLLTETVPYSFRKFSYKAENLPFGKRSLKIYIFFKVGSPIQSGHSRDPDTKDPQLHAVPETYWIII